MSSLHPITAATQVVTGSRFFFPQFLLLLFRFYSSHHPCVFLYSSSIPFPRPSFSFDVIVITAFQLPTPGCGGFGIRNFLTLFLSIEVSKAMSQYEKAVELKVIHLRCCQPRISLLKFEKYHRFIACRYQHLQQRTLGLQYLGPKK